jgi:hypothetical protein
MRKTNRLPPIWATLNRVTPTRTFGPSRSYLGPEGGLSALTGRVRSDSPQFRPDLDRSSRSPARPHSPFAQTRPRKTFLLRIPASLDAIAKFSEIRVPGFS